MTENNNKLKLWLGSIGLALVILGLGLAVLLTANSKPTLQSTESINPESGKPAPQPTALPSITTEPILAQTSSPTVTPAADTTPAGLNPSSGPVSGEIQNTPEPTVAATQAVEKTVKPPVTIMPGPPAKETPAKTASPTTSPINSTPIIATIAVTPAPANNPQSWQGSIMTISSTILSLNTYSEPILLTSATKITLGGVKVPLSNLKAGQRVTVLVVRNAQGQFVAQSILVSPLPPPQAGPPK